MKFALVNPAWDFEGSIYFGCREPHLPLEYGYAKAILEQAGHEARIIDGQLGGFDNAGILRHLEAFGPDFTVITTAPSYLFWRCAPPELRVPQKLIQYVREAAGVLVGVGPHASTTPRAALRKLDVDVVVLGECEEILPMLVRPWEEVPSICYERDGDVRVQGTPRASDLNTLPSLEWPAGTVRRHTHHHHRFEAAPQGPGAEVEYSRGCPYHCTFCAKENFRTDYRRRPIPVVMEEIDRLLAQGVEYIYFIDEIFLPERKLLEALVERKLKFGVQTRIDLWKPDMLELLGRAGCVSIEAGVESISEEGRALLDKKSKLTTAEFTTRLIAAKEHVPFVQANLLDAKVDSPEEVEEWRQHLLAHGVWANKPVPLFPYPGSPDYRRLWGLPDDHAWERAHQYYLRSNREFSDIQENQPLPLVQLESWSRTNSC